MNAKGSSVSEILIWAAIVASIFIGVVWFFSNFSYQRPLVESVNSDLVKIEFYINEACLAYDYSNNYNPLVEKGVFLVEEKNGVKEICIYAGEVSSCKKTLCEELLFAEIDLSLVKNIVISKKPGLDVNIYAE